MHSREQNWTHWSCSLSLVLTWVITYRRVVLRPYSNVPTSHRVPGCHGSLDARHQTPATTAHMTCMLSAITMATCKAAIILVGTVSTCWYHLVMSYLIIRSCGISNASSEIIFASQQSCFIHNICWIIFYILLSKLPFLSVSLVAINN